MTLMSNLFRGNRRLQSCLLDNSAHVIPGERGQHVSLIQYAVLTFEPGEISGVEINMRHYGPMTTKAVLAYKRARKIINPAYQSVEDNIVGRMTIAALDREMVLLEIAQAAGSAFSFKSSLGGR